MITIEQFQACLLYKYKTIAYPFAGHRVLHLSIILASFILRIFLVSYLEVLENLGKAFKLTYAKPLSAARNREPRN
jgi:hypothetical protein